MMKKKTSKRVCALLLSITMFVSLFAGITVPKETVSAASSATIDDMTALDALGIDTNEAPSGYDDNSTDNPYGRDITTASEVDELFVMHGDTNKTNFSTYGYNSPVLSSSQNEEYLLKNATPYGTRETVDSLSKDLSYCTIAVEGNFSYDNNGQKKQVAYLSIDKDAYWNATYADTYEYCYGMSLNLFVTNPENKYYTRIYREEAVQSYDGYCLCKDELPMASFRLDKEAVDKGETDVTKVANYEFSNPYLIMNYLKMAVGDYDGDGIDEIAFYRPIYDTGWGFGLDHVEVFPAVEIYDLRVMEGGGYMDADNWSLAKTINLESYSSTGAKYDLCPNMVSLSAADFDKDGTDDLAISYGYYGGYTVDDETVFDAHDTKTNVYFGERAGKLLTRSVSMTRDDVYRVGLSTGDVDGDGYNELVMGGSIKDGDYDERYVGVYEWNGSSFSMASEKKIDIFEKENDQYVYEAAKTAYKNRGYEYYYSSPVNTANITIGRFNGLSEPACIYIDGLLIEMGDSGLELIHMVDNQLNRNTIKDDTSIYDYVEWGARAVDLNGDGTDTLVVTRMRTKTHVGYSEMTFAQIVNNLFKQKNVKETIKVVAVGTSKPQNMWGNSSSKVFKGAAFAVPNLDNDTTILTYKKQHYYTYSDPEILAVLASPPFYKDLDTDDYAAVDPNATSYGSSKGSGGGDTYSNSFYMGVYTSYEHEFKIFGVPVASAEAEFEMKHDFTWETEQLSSVEYEAEYETYQGQDTIVLYSIPVETYVYTAKVPVLNDDGTWKYDTQDMTVNIPHEPTIKTLPLDDYEVIAKDYDELPQIAGNVLTHEMGNPSSYPSSKAELPATSSDMPVLIAPALNEAAPSTSFGLASQTRSIEMSSEETNSFNYEFEINTKAGAGAGGVTVGVTAGYSHGAGTVKISTSGSSYSGTIFDLSPNVKGYDYGFTWRLCAYGGETNDGKQFPVVTYLVTEAEQPPLLPEEFEQSEEGTGQEQITLTWSDENTPAGYAIYRYFRSAGSADFYEVAYVSASEPDNYEYKDGARYYSYTDTGLSPDTEYQYKIQTIGASGGKKSVPSAVLTAYTKPIGNVPVVSVYPEKTVAYPDKPTILTAVLENEDILENAKIYYAWQKLNEDGRTWDSLNSSTASSYSYRINNAGVDDIGYYRCRVTCQKDQTMVSTYTDKVKVDYSKRTAVMKEFKLDKDTVSVRVAGSDTNSIPSGIVVFTLEAASYEKEIAAEVDADGIASAKITATDGVYKLSASYNGSRVFKTGSISKDDNGENIFYTQGLSKGESYTYLDIGEYTYGDKLNIHEYTITAEGTVEDKGEIKYSEAEFGRYFDLLSTTGQNYENSVEFRSMMKFTDIMGTDENGKEISAWKWATYTSSEDGQTYNQLQIADERFKAGYAGFAGDICMYYNNKYYFFNIAKRDTNLWIDFSDLPDAIPYNELKGTLLSEDSDPSGTGVWKDISARIIIDNMAEFDDSQQYGTDRDMILNDGDTDFTGGIGCAQLAPIIGGDKYSPKPIWIEKALQDTHYCFKVEDGITFGFDPENPEYGFTKASLYEDASSVYLWNHGIGTASCYNFTFKDTSIHIMANTNPVNTEAVTVDGQNAGEISLVSPSEGKSFPAGTTLVFNAAPYDGYEIAGYEVVEASGQEEVEDNVEKFDSTSERFVWTMKDCKTTVKAIFKVKENTLTFEASPSEATVDGKVIGKNKVTGIFEGGVSVESGNVILAGVELEFSHKAAKGWHFTGWEYFPEGAQTQYISDDVFTMTMPDSKVRLFARFERDSYNLKLGDGLTAVDEDGKTIDTSKDIVGDTKITVKAKKGYSVTADSFTATSGVSDLDTNSKTYTFTLLKDTEVSAAVSAKKCKVNVTAENGKVAITDSEGNTIANGSSVSGGTALTFTAEADRGYKVSAWGAEASEKTTHTIVADGDIDLNVTFAQKDSKKVSVIPIKHAESSFTVNENGKETEVSTDSTDSDDITIYEGESLYVNVTPDKGFMMAGWNVSEGSSESYKSSTDKQYIIPYDSKITKVEPAVRSFALYDVNIGKDITATADGEEVTSGKIGSGVDLVFTFTGESSELIAWSVNDVIVLPKDNNDKTYSIEGLDRSLDISVKANHNYEWTSDETSHYRVCSCGSKTDEGAHEFVEVVDKVATSTEEGSKHMECRTCHYKQAAVTISKVATHNPTIQTSSLVAATCEKDGVVEYYYCKKCGARATDKDTLYNAHTTSLVDVTTCVIDKEKFFITKEHTPVVDTSTIVAATCLTGGYTGDTICETCDKLLECGSASPAIDHNFGYNELAEWSWEATDTGMKATATFDCEYCDEKKVVAATLTSATAGVTCTKDGTTTYTAKVTLNEKEYTDVNTIATTASGHKISENWSHDNSAHWHACSNCDAKCDWTAHTYDGGKVTKEATETAEGEMTYTCSECGKTKTEVIPKKTATTPEPPKKGDVVADDKASAKVEVTDVKKKEVAYEEPANKKAKTVSIPSTVKINGVTYKVTKIAKNAFSGATKLKTVKIGKNVTEIGANAFKGCKKLKTIKITSTKLTSKTVSKNAFKGLTKATTIKVPKKKLKAYKKLFKQKGLSSKVKVIGY